MRPSTRFDLAAALVAALALITPTQAQVEKPRLTIKGHASFGVVVVQFSPDGKALLTGSTDGTLKLWSLPVGKETATLVKGAGAPMGGGFNPFAGLPSLRSPYQFSRDGKLLFLFGEATPVVEVASGKAKLSVGKEGEEGGLIVAVHPEFKSVAGIVSENSRKSAAIALWDLDTGKRMPPLAKNVRLSLFPALNYSPDGKTLAAVLVEQTGEKFKASVRLWDIATSKEKVTFAVPSSAALLGGVEFSPDGKLIAVGGTLYDAATGKETIVLHKSEPDKMDCVAMWFSPDGKAVIGLLRGHNSATAAKCWDTKTGKEIKEPESLGWASDSRSRVQKTENGVELRDPVTGMRRTTMLAKPDFEYLKVALSPDGKTLAVGCYLGTIRIFDVPEDKTPVKPNDKPTTFKGSWDGRYVDDDDPRDKGNGTYEFHDEKDGRLKVTVSWTDYKTKKPSKMELEGKRLGPDAVSLKGKYEDTTYRYMGRMKDGELVLHYLFVNDGGRSGSGVSTLTRKKE